MSAVEALSELRKELDKINVRIFSHLNKRQQIVRKIQSEKCKLEITTSWSPLREKEIFLVYIKSYPLFDLEHDLLYSLLIEKQASLTAKYPRWSRLEHLREPSLGIEFLVNPVLLFLRDKNVYHRLDLLSEYKEKIERTFCNE